LFFSPSFLLISFSLSNFKLHKRGRIIDRKRGRMIDSEGFQAQGNKCIGINVPAGRPASAVAELDDVDLPFGRPSSTVAGAAAELDEDDVDSEELTMS